MTDITMNTPEAIKTLVHALKTDPEYAWSWHCNIAMAFYDAVERAQPGEDIHMTANLAAAAFLDQLAFGRQPAGEGRWTMHDNEIFQQWKRDHAAVNPQVDTDLYVTESDALIDFDDEDLSELWAHVARHQGGTEWVAETWKQQDGDITVRVGNGWLLLEFQTVDGIINPVCGRYKCTVKEFFSYYDEVMDS